MLSSKAVVHQAYHRYWLRHVAEDAEGSQHISQESSTYHKWYFAMR